MLLLSLTTLKDDTSRLLLSSTYVDGVNTPIESTDVDIARSAGKGWATAVKVSACPPASSRDMAPTAQVSITSVALVGAS